jgi:DNA replication protein DnaC
MTRSRDIPPNTLEELRRNLSRLKLDAMLEALDEALEQAQTLQQGYATFLAGLVEKQVLANAAQAAQRRVDGAKFPETKTFDSFDWTFQRGLNVQLVKDLMTLDFVRQGRPVLMLGKPGTGKSHMSLAYGHLAALAGHTVRYYAAAKLLAELYATLADGTTDRLVRRLARVDLLIIDDLRDLPPRPEYASLLYEVVEARHGKRATIVSSNLSVKAWGKTLGNPTLTASLVDRLMERAHVINIKRGRSYRTHGPEAPPEEDRPPELTNGTETET